MNPSEVNDAHYLRAAEGWLTLHRPVEANEELNRLSQARRKTAEVLILRWHIFARAQLWQVCLSIARFMTVQAPDDIRGWVVLGETYRALNRFAEAYRMALTKALEFSHSWQLLYEAARFGCLVGKTAEARQYLQLAMAIGDARKVKARAARDTDLSPLWL
ncbi:MAG: tetratricopeptide repeat protein [Verrucomicrobiota bacterium]